jgi:hypothetical protein
MSDDQTDLFPELVPVTGTRRGTWVACSICGEAFRKEQKPYCKTCYNAWQVWRRQYDKNEEGLGLDAPKGLTEFRNLCREWWKSNPRDTFPPAPDPIADALS